MKTKFALMLLLLTALVFNLEASDSLQVNQEYSDEELLNAYEAYSDSVSQQLQYEYGEVTLKNGLAKIAVPPGYKFLNGKDAEMVLTDLWGNPPSDPGYESLGMLFPEESTPMSDSSFVINITYTEDGYIDDSDASSIDYDELLEGMKEDTRLESETRLEMGYPAIKLIGWASAPYYDGANKKLHWAKELKFGDAPEHTLNYNIRVLGRKGFLELNAIGEMYVLGKVKSEIEPILTSVNFNEGFQYSDFDPDIDEVAAYGIGALIAGKVLAKAGILAKIGLFLAKGWKLIVLGLIALGAGVRRFFGKSDGTPA